MNLIPVWTAIIAAVATLAGVATTQFVHLRGMKLRFRFEELQRFHDVRLKAFSRFLALSRVNYYEVGLLPREERQRNYGELLEKLEEISLVSSAELAAIANEVRMSLFDFTEAQENLDRAREQHAGQRFLSARERLVKLARVELGSTHLDN